MSLKSIFHKVLKDNILLFAVWEFLEFSANINWYTVKETNISYTSQNDKDELQKRVTVDTLVKDTL